MNDKIRVSAVSYLNTKPLLYGIFKSPVVEALDLVLDIPSVCAQKLKNGQADLGLVPVAIIPELTNPHIISDFCIGTVGPVKTVCIYADRPLEQLKRIYLDYHSRTSVELAKILIQEYWKLDIEMLPARPGFETTIGGRTGALVIGDRTMGLDERHPYVYDLGEAWIAHTGLPFVFAAWVSNRPLDEDFITAFNQALQLGLDHLPELLYLLPAVHPGFDLKTYFTQNISYQLDAPKKQGLDLFLQKMGSSVFPKFAPDAKVNHQGAGLETRFIASSVKP
jgi:chorismate dehydratase